MKNGLMLKWVCFFSVMFFVYSVNGSIKIDSLINNPPGPCERIPDFSVHQDIMQKKQAFFEFLTPFIMHENALIENERRFVLIQYQLFASGEEISDEHFIKLQELEAQYRLKRTEFDKERDFRELLLRVDVIPASLAFTQAAIESAWGESNFALNANNIFGLWCFSEGCGVVPQARADGESHEVRSFKTINDCVRSYMKTLNTKRAYSHFRVLRYENRLKREPLDASKLVLGLQKYSSQGMDYVSKVRQMLRVNEKLMP